MAITIELPPDEERTLRQRAEAAGLDVATYLTRNVGLSLTSLPGESVSDEEWERLADEATSLVDPSVPPLSDYAVSREGIYWEHD